MDSAYVVILDGSIYYDYWGVTCSYGIPFSPSTFDRTNGTAFSILNSGYVTMYNGIDDGYSEIEFSYGKTSV